MTKLKDYMLDQMILAIIEWKTVLRLLLGFTAVMTFLVCAITLATPSAHAGGKWQGWHQWCKQHPHSHRAVCR